MTLGISILLFVKTPFPGVQDSVGVDTSELGSLLEPEPILFSFQTPGWYILFGVLFVIVVFVLIKWFRNYLKNAYRREAIKTLSVIEKKFSDEKDSSCLNDVLVLIKLVAIQAFGRQNVAQLYGEKWLLFLEEKGKETPFGKYANTISASVYKPENVPTEDVKQLFELSKKWIKTHA